MQLTPATRQGLSLAVGTGMYGISFGALAVAAGLPLWQTVALSLLLFSGGSQFGLVGVVAGGGAPVTALSTAALLGVRNAIYGLQMNALLRPTGWRRLAAAHVTIDESAAVALAQDDTDEQHRGFWVTGLAILVLWTAFTVVGALVGDALGDTRRYGLDGAAFLGLLWPRLRAREGRAVGAVCALVTLLSTPALPAGVPILVAAAVALAIGWARRGARGDEPVEVVTEDHPPARASGGAPATDSLAVDTTPRARRCR